MTKLKTLLPIKVLSVFMAILMIFSTMSIMFTVSALTKVEGGGEGTWRSREITSGYGSNLKTETVYYFEVTGISGNQGLCGQSNNTYSNQSIQYSVYLPKNYESYADNEPGKKLAVMVVMSGGGAYFNTNATTDVNNKTANNSGEDSTFAMARSTGLNYLADEMGIILIYFRQSNSTINQGWYWNFFRSSDQVRGNSSNDAKNYMLPKLLGTINSIKDDYSDYIDDDTYATYLDGMSAAEKDQYNRTYITGISAGGAQTASFISVYPEEFAGAAIVAGLPYKMLQDKSNDLSTLYAVGVNNKNPGTDKTAIKAYQAAMDGTWQDYTGKTVQYFTVGSNSLNTNVRNYPGKYPSYETLAGYITTAWDNANKDTTNNKTGVTVDETTAPRVIVLQGGKDKVVHPKNGRLTAEAFAKALDVHDGNVLNVNVSNADFVNSVEGDINGKGYTVHYYGTDSEYSTKKTSDGYSKLAASQVVYYQFDDVAHQWVNRYADGFYSTKPSYANQNTNADYNHIMWEFFEGSNEEETVVPPEFNGSTEAGTETTTLEPSKGALFGIYQKRGPNNNNAGQVLDSAFNITGMDLVSAQGLKLTTTPLAYDYMETQSLKDSENDGLWNFTFDIQGLYNKKVAQYPNKDVRIVSISVKQNVWSMNYGSPMLCMSYAVVDKLTFDTETMADDAVMGQDATRLDIQELSPSNENVLLSGTITDAKDLEALKSGYLNVVTFDSAYGSNHNVAAPVIEVKFSLSDKAAEGDENDTPVTGDPTTTKTSAKLFPICAYNSAAGYNAVEAEGYETKTYSGDVKNLAEGKAGHLTGTASKYSVGVYNAEDKNDTIYYSFNLSDYTKNNGYTIKSVTISYTLEGNPYYSKESVGVNVLMSGNQYWEAKTDAPAKGSMVNVESFSLSKGQKIEGEITISADTQSKLINYINNLGGLTIGFENTASNPHYYFLSTMPTITVVYEKATNVDVEPGAITGVGIRTDKDYGDLVDDWTELGTEVKDTVTLGDLTFTADKPKYANSVSTSNNGFSDASGTAEAKRNYMTVVAGFDVYGAVREQLLTELQKTNKDVRIRSIQINSASITIAALYADSGATGVDATLYIHSSAQSSTISNGSQLTSSNGTQIGDSFVPTSTSSQKHTYENVDLSGVNFSDDTPYLWTRVEGGQTTSGSWMNQKTYTVYVGVPQLSNISVSYVADVIPKDDGGDEPVQIPDPEFTTDVTKSNGKATITVTTNEPYKYIKIGDTPLSNPSAGQNGVNVFTYQVDVLEDDVTYTVSASVDGTTFSDKTTTVTVTGTGPIVAPPTEGIPEGYEWYATPVKDVTGNTTIALESGYYANNNNKEQETNKSSNGYTTYWNSATQGTSISNAYGLIANYNVGNTFESIKTPIYNSYLSDYKPEDGYLIDVEVSVSSATMTTTARSNGYSFTFYAIAASSAFDAYHSSMKSGVTTTATSTNTTSGSGKLLTVSFSSLPEITSNNKYLTLYYGASQYNANYSIYNMLSGMTLNYTYTVNIYKEQVKDPIRDVTVSEPTLDNSTITFTVTTEPTHTKVKIGSQTISSYQVVNDKNVFTYTIEAPSVNTSYKVSAALNGVFDTEYERTVEVEGFDPEPLQSVTNNATDTTVTFNISTYKTYKYVKVVNASTGTEYPEPNFVKDGNLNIFQVAVPAPDDDTIYIVYASKDGVNYDERTVEVKVKGTKVVVQDKVINATGNFFTNLNTGYADTITGPTYDDVREITTITNTESNKDTYNYNNLGSTVSGYIVGANNSSYYSKDSNNYFTSTRRNTGSPIANTAIKAGYSTFPVSYLGYAYINYDLSGTFDKLESSTDSGYKRDESASREGLIVEYRTRTETVISDIKVNYVRAQEGYVGGWANRYTVSGASFVTAGSKVADGAQLPTGGYQSLGDGSVSTSMANIGAASSLNSQQMADAKNSENVTVWVKNTGCDWNSRYFSSAWLLVEVPVVTVTYKTITYTDKRITETKKVAGQSIVTKSDVIEGDTQSTTITEPYGGYLLGRGYGAGSDYRNETVNPDSNQLSNESNYNVQSNVDLRIGTTTGYYGTTYKNFGISYLGKGYVLYDLSSVKGEKTEDTLSKNTETRYIDGKFVEVEVVKKKITETTISGITVSGSIKAGFQANSGTTENNANSYNITNMVYAIGSSRWANQGTTTGGTNNKGKYPADDAAWQALNVVYGIKKEGKTYTGHLNEATLADVMNSGYLTVRIDNCFNDWQSGGTLSNAYVAAWTLASFPQVNVEFSTVEYIETTVTPVDTTGGTTFNPTYEVYAQYNFISADGEVLSKTKLMGTMTGYGASAEVVPYIVDPVSGVDENDQPFVNFGKVEYLSSNGTLVDGKSVEISMDASRKDKYVLKDAYIEDVNTEIATLTSSGDNKYIITSTLDEDIKTNDIYKVRIIFDYYMEEASEPVTENSVKVNLHAHFLDSNGDEYGKIYTAGFAHLHNSSYILSLDDVNIPYGDVTLSGTKQVSAVFGTHQIYKFDSTKTEINIANATGGVVPNTYNTEVSTSDYLAKAYLDIGTDNTPSAGDILVVTYNGKNETSGQEIDVHLYYIEEPMYTFDVNYEFRFNGSFGEPAIIHTAESLKDQTFYKGSYVLPYDLLVNSTTIEIDELEYNISDFTCNIVPNGVVLNGNEVVSASGDNPSVTFVYTYKDPIQTKVDATVKHKYVINGVVNGVSKSDEIYLPNTTAILGNPEDTSVKSLLDNTAVVSTTFGTFKASDFVVSGIREVTDYGVTFKAYDHANGKYPTDFVPRNVTEIATIEITYTLQVYEIKVVETFTQNGSTQVNYKETTAYIPQNAMYTFNSSFGADFEPANDGVKLSAYTVTFSGDDVDNEIYVPGSVSFSVVGLTGGKTVYINYDYATSVDVKVENEFYINNTKLPADALVGVIPGKTEFTLAKDATEIIALATGKVVYNGTEFNVSDFVATGSTGYAGITVTTNGDVISATLNKHNGSTATITVRYYLTVYAVNFTEVFTKDGVEVERKSTPVYLKAGDDYTFTSTYKTGSIISNVALGDYITDVDKNADGAATYTVENIAANTDVTINYAVSTKTTAKVEYVYIVNNTVVNDATLVDGVDTMNLVYNTAVSAPSSTGYVTLAGDAYYINDFDKNVTVSGAATAAGNDVTLNAYNVANGDIIVTVTYELTVRTKADVAINHKYFINNVELTGSAIAGVTAGTGNLTLDYNVSQTIDKSTGTVNYNGTEFNLSQFDVSVVDVNSNVLSVNGLNVKLIKYNVSDQTITVRYNLTVYTVVVNEIFYIDGTEAKTVTNTYYVSKDAALEAVLSTESVNGIAVSNFIVSEPATGEIVDGKYIATVNGDGPVTIEYNVSTKTNVNITSIFKVNGSADGVDTSNVINATATQTVEYGVSTAITLAGGYVIWNGTQFNVSDFTASITNYDAATIAESGLNVTLNKYNTAATDIVITYELTVRSVTLTENFIVDGETIETQVTTKWYVDGAEYTFVSNYGSSYEPTGTSIALSNFNMSSDCGATRYGDKAQFTGVADADKTAAINYSVVTKAPVVQVTHKYFFNGVEIESGLNITAQGDTQTSLTYGVSTSIKVSEGTYTFINNGNETVFDLSGANVDIVVTSESDVTVEGTNVTLNSYNPTAIKLTVNYYLTTVVVNITEVIITDNGEHTKTETHTFYLLDGDTFGTFESSFEKVMMNGVEIPYSMFDRTVTGADSFDVETTESAIFIKGVTDGQGGDITITYSGVKTVGKIRVGEKYYYKVRSSSVQKEATKDFDFSGVYDVKVGDRIPLNPDTYISFTEYGAQQSINSSYFSVYKIEATGYNGFVDTETNEFVVTYIEPQKSTASITTDIKVWWSVDLYDDVNVVHEFYVNNKYFTSIEELLTEVQVTSSSNSSGSDRFVIVQKRSGTITNDAGTSYNIAELIANGSLVVDDSLIEATGLTIKRSTLTNHTHKFAVQSFDFPRDDCKVVIRYDITTTLEETEATVNTHFVNNGEYVGSLFTSETNTLKLGDVIATTITKNINGIDVEFTLDSVVANGITIVDGVVTEIAPKATEFKVDLTYVASASASVNLTHNFYVGDKLLGTITDGTVVVNLANHSGKFAALSGIVGLTTDKGIVYVDASRFEVSVEDNACGTLADRIFTLNASALNGSTYNVVINYNVDGISFAIDGEVGVKQTASAINANGQYNVVTTITSVGNLRPVDLIFVVDVSAGAGGVTNEKLEEAKAAISDYITNSFDYASAVKSNVRVAIVTYADGYEILTGGYITDKDTALATVEGITLATAKDGYDVTASNLQAGLYGARTLMNADVSVGYTDVIVFKGSEPNAAYSKYNADSYNYSDKIEATADVANAGAAYELGKMNASKEIVIDLATEADLDATMTHIFDVRNYINLNGEAYIMVNINDFTFVSANGVKVNGVDAKYSYRESDGLISLYNLGTLKGTVTIEYTVELKNTKVDGDYFVSDTSSNGIKVKYDDAIRGDDIIVRGVSARVNYNTTTTGATITVITYLANKDLSPVGMDGLTIKNFYENAIIGEPIVYTISGVTNLTAGTTYDVKAPAISGYTLWDNQESTQTVTIPAGGENAVVYFGYYASGAIVDDSIVYDDSSAVVFDVLANDARPTGEKFTAIYGIGATEADAIAGNKNKVSTANGDLIIVEGSRVRFAPNGITVTTEFYYSVQDGNVIRVAKIYIVPATIVKGDVTTDLQVQIGDRWTVVYDVMEGIAEKNIYDNYEAVTKPTSNVKPGATNDNIVSGMDYQLTGERDLNHDGDLTDGIISGDSLSNGSWIGWRQGVHGEIIFDLGVDYRIDAVRVHTYVRDDGAGVRAADYKLSVSDDGVNYVMYTDGSFSKGSGVSRETFWSELELKADGLFAGRYVKISFTNPYSTFISEIEIKGSSREKLDISYGAKYEVISGTAHTGSKYQDDGKRLTDSSAINWDVYNGTADKYAGWTSDIVEIVVDLGRVRKAGSFAIYAANDTGRDNPICAPEVMEIYVSTDGKDYDQVNGSLYKKGMTVKDEYESLVKEGASFTRLSLVMDEQVDARYVKFVIHKSEGDFIWLDEIEVNSAANKSEPTYDNLLSGKTYTSTYGTENNPGTSKYTANLTDGVAYSHYSYDEDWAGHLLGSWFGVWNNDEAGNTVDMKGDFIFDLGEVYDLSKVRIHLDNHIGYGASAPKSIRLWVSTDGKNYDRYVDFALKSDDEVCYWSELDNMKRMIGRYLKIEVELATNWAFINEIEAYGTPVVDIEDADYNAHFKSDDLDIIYGGHKENADGEYGFDNNSAIVANRYQDYIANGNVDGDNKLYTATFTFEGTGFDIISVTGKYSGYMTIKTTDSAGKPVTKASGTITTFAKTENIYQATVFTCTDLPLNTYKVEVMAERTFLSRLGMLDANVYVDSVRTYNPFANNTNVHYNELQNGSTTETLKSIFVDGKLAVSTGGNGLFTASGYLDINSYMNIGTNNAINIVGGQSLLFKLDEATARTTFQVEMAAVNSKAKVNVKVNSNLVETLVIDTGVFAYYDFSKYIRESSTVNFEVVEGQVTFSKVRYNHAKLGKPEGEKYTTDKLATVSAPDAERMTDAYTVNTARLISRSGKSRTITAFVYTSTNANAVIAYVGKYRVAANITDNKLNSNSTQRQFMVTFTIPDDVAVDAEGMISIDFYAYDSVNNVYSSNCKTVVYTLVA